MPSVGGEGTRWPGVRGTPGLGVPRVGPGGSDGRVGRPGGAIRVPGVGSGVARRTREPGAPGGPGVCAGPVRRVTGSQSGPVAGGRAAGLCCYFSLTEGGCWCAGSAPGGLSTAPAGELSSERWTHVPIEGSPGAGEAGSTSSFRFGVRSVVPLAITVDGSRDLMNRRASARWAGRTAMEWSALSAAGGP